LTEKLYSQDSYLKQVDANIVERGEVGQRPAVVLDRTIFYPTSGGQMHDEGKLNETKVVDVVLSDDKIWHLLESPIANDQVQASIDWDRRFDFMQQHTGFHILAQSFLRVVKAETLSSHLGEQYSTIDVQTSWVNDHDLAAVERLANRVVWENRPVKVRFVSEEEVAGLSLRKAPTVEGMIRLIDIEDFDLDPCGGTHVKSTAEVGLIKILSGERIRGHSRFTFVAGGRAHREFTRHQQILQRMSFTLSTGLDELNSSIEKMLAEEKKLVKQTQKLLRELAERSAQDLVGEGRMLPIVVRIFADYDAATLRWIAGEATKRSDAIFLLATESENPAVVFATSREGIDLKAVFDRIAPMIAGKGGGSKNFIQGGGREGKRLAEALATAKELARQQVAGSA